MRSSQPFRALAWRSPQRRGPWDPPQTGVWGAFWGFLGLLGVLGVLGVLGFRVWGAFWGLRAFGGVGVGV